MTSTERRSQVMKEAWEIYHFLHKQYSPSQFDRGIIDGSMKRCLTTAWEKSKKRWFEEDTLKSLTPDQIAELERLLQARDDCKHMPSKMSMRRAVEKIDREINELVGFDYRK